jgi:NtrC-family two-component system sensor histidine kinase KinB
MLRTRIFLNLLPFVVILLAVGVYAIVLFSSLANSVDSRVRSNYDGMIAAQTMSLELSRMDRGALLALQGDKSGQSIFEENRTSFEEKLKRQLGQTNLAHEAEFNRELLSHYEKFSQGTTRMFPVGKGPEPNRIYEQEAYPNLLSLYVLLDKVRQLKQQAILESNKSVEKLTHHVTGLMVTGLIIALVISSYACYHLARSILRPIQLLTTATYAAGEGDLDQLVPVISKDELGELARSFNKMAGQIRAYRLSTTEKLLRLHRTMETTLASFPDPIYVLNREGRIELTNPAAEELSKTLGLDGELPEPLPATARQVLDSGENFLPDNYQAAISLRLEGHDRYFLPRILAMRHSDDSPLGVAVVLYDMTRFRRLDYAKSSLVANASHELKTPLTSVRMALHLLTEKADDNLTPRQKELLLTARNDAERLLGILNDLLDLARLEEGHSELRKEYVSAADLTQDVLSDVSAMVAARGIKLRSEVSPDLPPLKVDRHFIGLALGNLLTNAAKHSPPGEEILLRAILTASRRVQFSVTDHGPGVPREYQERIFDRFFRVPGQVKNGAGLGLSIAKEIVGAHGGRIGVKSRSGQGSEFFINLPCVEKEEVAAPA